MKKLLIATAALAMVAGTAQAQSSVEIYGVLDKAYSNLESKVTAAGGAVTTTETTTTGGSGNGDVAGGQNYTTERIGFRGTEDLGGGLKANFVYEARIGQLDNADSGGEAGTTPTRLAFVGLSGGFGSIAMGRQTSLMEAAYGAGNSSNQNNFIGTLYVSGQKFNNSRSDRLVTYTSPKMGAFTLAVQYGEREVKTTTTSTSVAGQDEMTVNLSYAAGPLTAVLSHTKEETKAANAVTAKPEATVLGANYNFGPATAFVTYAEGKNKVPGATANDREAYEVGVKVPMKAWTFQASTYDGKDKVTATATDSDVSGYQLSALYNFSKRTNLYAVIGSDEVKNTAAGTKTERDTYGVGVRHMF
jgi:predicted porin